MPTIKPLGTQFVEFEVYTYVYSYQGTFQITDPQYYLLTGDAEYFQHTEIVADDCQADYEPAFADGLGAYSSREPLSSIALLDYDSSNQTTIV